MSETMTGAERTELARIVRINYRVARAAVDQRKSEVLADFDEKLAKQWRPYDAAWEESMAEVREAVEEVNRRVAVKMAEHGVPGEWAPRAHIGWQSRGD